MTPEERETAIEFLQKHYLYRGTYARCVKIRKLRLDYETAEACYAILDFENYFEITGVTAVIDRFYEEHPEHVISSEGRSCGYLCLYTNPDLQGQYRSLQPIELITELADDTLEKLYRLVQDFDDACDDAVNTFVKFAKEHEVVEKQITETVTRKVRVVVRRDGKEI